MSTVAVGHELAGYRIDALIARGGMGVVYRGTDLRLERPVAIKLIAAEHASDPLVRRRFEREARLMAALDHPNVLPVYGAGEEDGCLFLVMRHVAGTDLATLLRREGRLEAPRAARIVDQVAQALDAAHRAGLVHRDVKPANVLLAGAQVYLSDFGIGRAMEGAARLTGSNEWLGTVDFCSPEQLRGEPTDGRSDVYALGCVLHTALTGVPPLHRETAPATMLAHLGEDPPPPSVAAGVPRSFDDVVGRALAKRPADRFATAGDLGRAACAAAGVPSQCEPILAPSEDPAESPTRTRRRPGTLPTTRRQRRPEDPPAGEHPAATRLDLRPPRLDSAPPPTPPRRVKRAALVGLATIGASVAAALATLVAVGVLALGSGAPRTGPLSAAEITGVVRAFAAAYGHRDPVALARLLAPGVTRVSPSAVEHGRDAVLAEYQTQFDDASISSYRVQDLQVQPGPVGRGAARYTVVRDGRAPVSGDVAFGVERVGGRPLIGLIATQPPG